MVKVAPSILAANFEQLEEEINDVINCGADLIHIDVMDGEFVKNITPGMEMYERSKRVSNIPLDTHLMVKNPKEWIDMILQKKEELGKCNLQNDEKDIITFHIEAIKFEEIEEIIDKLHNNNIKAGIAIKPKTKIDEIKPFLNKIDMILIMTVEPGYGGQKMIDDCLKKIKLLRKIDSKIDIEVDGGINMNTSKKVITSGANVLVAGTAIFKEKDRKIIINQIRNGCK